MKFHKLISITAICLMIVIASAACQERPATPFPTANPSQDNYVDELYGKAHDPWEAESVLNEFGSKDVEAQKVILTYYVDVYLQQSGFGLSRMRMELLKGLISFYYYDFNPAEILNVTRELPSEGSTGFAFLPPRTIVVIAKELHTLWQTEKQNNFTNQASKLFLEMGTDSSQISAFVRSLEINNYFVRMENKEVELSESLSNEYQNVDIGVSMEYPRNWVVAEFEQGFTIFAPGSSASISILQPIYAPPVNELISVFRQEAQQSDPYLKLEEGIFAEYFGTVDEKESVAVSYQLEYPAGQDNTFVVNVVALKKEEMDWILITGYEGIEDDAVDTLKVIVETIQLGE